MRRVKTKIAIACALLLAAAGLVDSYSKPQECDLEDLAGYKLPDDLESGLPGWYEVVVHDLENSVFFPPYLELVETQGENGRLIGYGARGFGDRATWKPLIWNRVQLEWLSDYVRIRANLKCVEPGYWVGAGDHISDLGGSLRSLGAVTLKKINRPTD